MNQYDKWKLYLDPNLVLLLLHGAHSRLGDQLAREVGVVVVAAYKVCALVPLPLHVNPANKREADTSCNVTSNLRKTGSMFESAHFGKLRKWAGSGQLGGGLLLTLI